jgi:hypothetical protein
VAAHIFVARSCCCCCLMLGHSTCCSTRSTPKSAACSRSKDLVDGGARLDAASAI